MINLICKVKVRLKILTIFVRIIIPGLLLNIYNIKLRKKKTDIKSLNLVQSEQNCRCSYSNGGHHMYKFSDYFI